MRQRIRHLFSILLVCAMVLSLLPISALADEPGDTTPTAGSEVIKPVGEPAPQAETTSIYVSERGSDSNTGAQDAPYATLKKAVDAAPDGATIYVMTNLTVDGEVARITNKHLTITSVDPEFPVTLTRGSVHGADNNQSHYNSAMIEVTTDGSEDSENASSVTLTNIILTDDGKHDGTYFAQTNMDSISEDNKAFVQDSMVTAHGLSNRAVYITLGNGAVLKDYGGMSAVYGTTNAHITMQAGAVICDDSVTNRSKSPTPHKDETGPAGAVWIQGAEFTMNEGAEIKDMVGRAVYADGGTATINGTISDITGDNDMWQGKSGIVHIRNGAEVTLKGMISNIHGAGSTCVYVVGGDHETSKFYMNEGAAIRDCDQSVKGIQMYGNNSTYVYMNGEITGLQNDNAININVDRIADFPYNGDPECVIGPQGSIHGNKVTNGAIYIQTHGGTLDIYGQITNNTNWYTGTNDGRNTCAGLYMAHNYETSTVTMHEGAEISNNTAGNNSGLIVSKGTFIMEGGSISGNIATGNDAGVTVRNGGKFIMKGGTISDNMAGSIGAGVIFYAQDYGSGADTQVPYVEIQGGTITGNKVEATVEGSVESGYTAKGGHSNDIMVAKEGTGNINRYLTISNNVVVGDENIYLEKGFVVLTNPGSGVKFGNASDDALSTISTVAENQGLNGTILASLWCSNEQAVTDLQMSKPVAAGDDMPIYAAVVEADAAGTAASGAEVKFYAVTEQNGMLNISFPSTNSNGYIVALVQPSEDYGTMTLTAPAAITSADEQNGAYAIPYNATYRLSDNLKAMISTNGGLNNIQIAIQLDPKLTVDPAAVTFISQIFNADRIAYDSGLLTISASLKNGWNTAADVDTSIQFNALLNKSDYVGGTVLAASGSFSAKVPLQDDAKTVYVPSDAVVTELKADININASAGANGTITPSGSVSVAYGGSQSFTITADSGYHIQDVLVDGVSQGAIGSYSFRNVTTNHTIRAVFAENTSGTDDNTPSEYTLRYETNGGKKINAETYKNAWTKAYEDLPVPVRDGYVFAGWYRDSNLTMPVTGDVRVNSSVVTLFAKWSGDGLTPDDTGVSRWLNTEDHFAYLQGMPNNLFGPGQNITRAEVAQMFYNLLLNQNVPTTVAFTDVAADAWYADAVNALASMGILNGVGGGKFEPTRNITRAEFTAIAMRFGDLGTTGTNPFSDVAPSDWFYDEVVGSVQYGWIKGFTDGTFRPYLTITRAEVTVITNRMLGRSADQSYVDTHSDELRQFTDVGADNWAYYDIAEATNSHDYVKTVSGETWTK